MRLLRRSSILIITLVLLSVNIAVPLQVCRAYTTSIQELTQQDSTQILRITLDPAQTSDYINVNIYTSNNIPRYKEKTLGNKSHIIELYDTSIGTTNNISLQKVAEKVSAVKLVPYLNTSNPEAGDMTRIIIEGKSPDLKYNINFKSVKTTNSNASGNKVSAKFYYPPGSNDNNVPQSMAIFTPLDDNVLAKLPQERKTPRPEISSLPTVPSNSTDAITRPATKKLTFQLDAPTAIIQPPPEHRNIQDLPDIDGTLLSQALPPPKSIPPASEVVPASPSNDPLEGVESPQPAPKTDSGEIETILSRETSFVLALISGFLLLIASIVAYTLYRHRTKSHEERNRLLTEKMTQAFAFKGSQSLEGLEQISELDLAEQPKQQVSSPGAIAEEVEEVIVLDNFKISEIKTLYLIKFANAVSLVGLVNEEVNVLNSFSAEHFATPPNKMKVSKEGSVIGKDLFLVTIGSWKGIISSENDNVLLHSKISD